MQILQEISTLGSYWDDFGCHFESQWADLRPGWTKNQIKSMPQIDAKISWLLEGPGEKRVRVRIDAFLRHLGDFGCHFGSYWPPKGFRNHIFRLKFQKVEKMEARKRGPNKR